MLRVPCRTAAQLALVLVLAPTPVALAASTRSTQQQRGAAAPQRGLFELFVNEVSKGEVLVVLRPPDYFVPVDALERAGLTAIKGQQETIDGVTYVALISLLPGIEYRVNEHDLTLRLTARAAHLPITVKRVNDNRPRDIFYSRSSSAFLNYAATWRGERDRTIVGEAGIRFAGALLSGTWSTSMLGSSLRGPTSVTFDDRTRLTRWVIGDLATSTGLLGGGAFVGGVTVSREYGLDPYFVRHPSPGFPGVANTPSTVELYVNDQLIRREQLPPGSFEFDGMPLPNGRGVTRMVVRDVFGREQHFTRPYYLAASTLAPGLHEFSYTAGFQRNRPQTANWDYGEWMLLGRHRVGLSDAVTVGFRAEATRILVSLGPIVSLRAPFGEFEFTGGASREGGVGGAAGSASYGYVGRAMSFGGAVRGFDSGYTTVSLPRFGDRARVEANVYTSFPIFLRNSLTLQYSTAERTIEGLSTRASLATAFRLGSKASLLLNLSRTTRRAHIEREGFVGLSIFLDGRTSANAMYRHRDTDGHQDGHAVTNVQRSLPTGTGYGYQLQTTDAGRTSNGLLTYQGPWGRYELGHERLVGRQVTTATVSGALVAIGGGIYPTRTIQNSFALVRVPKVPGVDVLLSNQVVGRTNRNGNTLVPSLLSYYGNRIGIADQTIPLDYTVGATEKTIGPPYRGGALVVFPVRRTQASTGTIVVHKKTEKVIPDNGRLSVSADGERFESMIGLRGEFYLENLPAGQHTAMLEYKGLVCETVLSVPVSDQPLVSLGTVDCKVRGK